MQTSSHQAAWRSTLRSLETGLQTTAQRIFPSSFHPEHEEMHAVPRPLSYQWSSLTEALLSVECSGIMTRLPLFWQVEAPLFEAAKAANAFIFVNEADNMPLGMAALRQANVDTVITTAADADEFLSYLLSGAGPAPLPRTWIIIHSIESVRPPAPRPGTMFQEIHAVPGVPAFTQCAHAARVPADMRFHLADACEHTADGILFRDAELHFLYPSSLPIKTVGVCDCGKEAFHFGHA